MRTSASMTSEGFPNSGSGDSIPDSNSVVVRPRDDMLAIGGNCDGPQGQYDHGGVPQQWLRMIRIVLSSDPEMMCFGGDCHTPHSSMTSEGFPNWAPETASQIRIVLSYEPEIMCLPSEETATDNTVNIVTSNHQQRTRPLINRLIGFDHKRGGQVLSILSVYLRVCWGKWQCRQV